MTANEKALEALVHGIFDAIQDAASELGGEELGNVVASALTGVIRSLDESHTGFKASVLARLEEKPN